MWIIFKLIVMVVAFLIRWFFKNFGKVYRGQEETINQKTLFVRKISNKHQVVDTVFRFEFSSQSLFKLSLESEIDQFFKKVGIANEVQTGDTDFDQKIYVASDSSLFRDQIKQDTKLRQLVLGLFKLECESIEGNGQYVSFKFPGDRSNDQNLKQELSVFFALFSELNLSSNHLLKDPFSVKVLFAEALIWSMAAYAWTSYFSWTFGAGEIHLNPLAMISYGLVIGLSVLAVVVFIIAKFFKGSSRGHRIFIESVMVLGLSLPIGGISSFHDINTFNDNSLTTVIEAEVISNEEKISRRRSNRAKKSYHLEIRTNSEQDKFNLKTRWKISREQFDSIGSNKFVQFRIKSGRLMQPWIQSIEPLATE